MLRRKAFTLPCPTVLLALVLAGCVNPGEIDPTIVNRYEIAMAERSPQQRVAMTGPNLGMLQPAAVTGPKLRITEGKPARVRLSLDEAVQRTALNSLDIRAVSFDSEMARDEMIKAAAQFDYVVFGGYNYTETHYAILNPLDPTHTQEQDFSGGLKEHTVTGADASLEYTEERLVNNTPGNLFLKSFQPKVLLQVNQPLLQGAWPEFNLATLKIAQLNHKISEADFRKQIEDTLAQTVTFYWQLVQARRNLEIQQNLLDESIDTLKKVQSRQNLDATAVQIKQSAAAVEARRALVVTARRTIFDVQDALVRQMADRRMSLLNDFEIIPDTAPGEAEVKYDVNDQLLMAMTYNPQMEHVRYAISQADSNIMVAKNLTLPQLNFAGNAGYSGIGPTPDSAGYDLADMSKFTYAAGVNFQYPLGNRLALANLQEARYQRSQDITVLQDTADQVAVAVKTAIRKIRSAYEQLQAQRAAVAAGQIELQALEDTEKIREKLTPEFLQLKLQAQESLAAAQTAEMQAVVDYNTGMIELAHVAGTVMKLHHVEIAMPKNWNDTAWPADQLGIPNSVNSRPK